MELFNLDVIDRAFEFDFENSTSEPTPKERIRAYSKRYYEWIGNAATKLREVLGVQKPETITKLEPVGQYDCCPKCEGDKFIFIRNKGRHVPCGRCGGKGYVTEADKLRHKAYLARKAKSRTTITFDHYLRPVA